MTQKVLSYDLGGTKIAIGIVSARGRILEEKRVPARFENGKDAVLKQLIELGKEFLKKHPEAKKVGIASAGPLDPNRGILLDPTNFASEKGRWGRVPISKILSQSLKLPVYLENDAAAAILAEHWIGDAKKYKNAMVLTLGTGLGTGILCNGELVRTGRFLHPEAGHVILNAEDTSAPCGCGNLGCAEAYLSGRNFSRRARQRFGDSSLSAKDIADLARKQDPRALAAFSEYAKIMAIALQNYIRIYCPEIILFTGSFAEAADLFLAQTEKHLSHLLIRLRKPIDLFPRLKVSSLKNQAGLIGGAYVAFRKGNSTRRQLSLK